MKATGIVRKIDELGRVVIPKEIRKALRIREGDPLEIYTEKNGEIIFKKYAPLGDLLELATQYADTLNSTSGFIICITDKDSVIAVAGTQKSNYLGRDISKDVMKIMEDRATFQTKDERRVKIIKDDTELKYVSQVIAPIISDADAIGTVVIFSLEDSKRISTTEVKLAQTAALFLGKQMEG